MRNIFWIIFFGLISLLAYLSFRLAFSFDLRSEDFYSLWYPYHGLMKETFMTLLFQAHPISAYEEYLLTKFFGYDPISWHKFGYLLKVVDSLLVTLLIWKLTLSKKAAIFSGLIFASSVVGLESYIWLSGQAPALEIIPMLLGLYFWISSIKKSILDYRYFLAVIFFLLAIYGDLGRAISIIPLAIFWDFLLFMQKPAKNIFLSLFYRLSIVILSSAAIIFFTKSDFKNLGTLNILGPFLDYLVKNPFQALLNFFYAIGPSVIGWLLPLWESDHQTIKNTTSLIGGIILFLAIVVILKLKLNARNKMILIFLLLWIPLNYLSSWVFRGMYLGVVLPGTTHRYLLISSIGLAGVLGFLVSRFQLKISIFLLSMILIANIFRSNQILSQQLPYMSYNTHNSFWNMVDREVPKDKKELIFLFISYDPEPFETAKYIPVVIPDSVFEPIMVELAATYSVPFALRRNITKINEIPITTMDRELVKDLLCKTDVKMFNNLDYGVFYNFITQKFSIPLENLYAWVYKGNSIVDVSNEQREKFRKEVDCKLE